MKIWVVWDNDDFGSTFSPSPDEIDSAFIKKEDAEAHLAKINKNRPQHSTKAWIKQMEVK